MLGLGAIFTIFFITLGPLKLRPFAQQTRSLDSAKLRGIAFRACGIGVVAVGVGGYIGSALAAKWNISAPAIVMATGIIFLLVALNLVIAPYNPVHAVSDPLPRSGWYFTSDRSPEGLGSASQSHVTARPSRLKTGL